jgi:hypothetical protein
MLHAALRLEEQHRRHQVPLRSCEHEAISQQDWHAADDRRSPDDDGALNNAEDRDPVQCYIEHSADPLPAGRFYTSTFGCSHSLLMGFVRAISG